MNIGVAVVTHNNAGTITACIKSLRQHGLEHIVIVDNASSDTTIETAAKAGVEIIKNNHNKGFAAAVNQAIAEITNYKLSKIPHSFSEVGQITNYLLLNPDAELQSSLAPAIDYLKGNPTVGIIGFGLRDQSSQPERYSHGQTVTPLSFLTRRIKKSKVNGIRHLTESNVAVPVGWVSGAAMLIRREVFDQLNGFDAGYFMYWEDVDFCRRAGRAGYKTIHMPDIAILHHRGTSLPDNAKKTALYDTSADRYFRKHYPKPIWLLLRALRRTYRFFSPSVH